MKQRTIKLISGAIVIFLAISLFFPLTVSAETYDIKCPLCGDQHQLSMLDSFSWVYNFCKFIYHDGSSLKDMGLSGVLAFDTSSAEIAPVWGQVEGFYDALKVIGIILVIIYFTMNIYDGFSQDRLTPESIMLSMIKLVASVLIIENGFAIVQFFSVLAAEIFGALQDGTVNAIAGANCNFEFLVQAGTFDRIGEGFKLLIAYALISISVGLMQFFCYLRLFDILLRAIFAPIGMADLGFKGTNGSGWRYLKKFMASCLQGGVMLACIFVHSTLSAGTHWIIMLILYIAMIGIFRKAQSIAEDMVGA